MNIITSNWLYRYYSYLYAVSLVVTTSASFLFLLVTWRCLQRIRSFLFTKNTTTTTTTNTKNTTTTSSTFSVTFADLSSRFLLKSNSTTTTGSTTTTTSSTTTSTTGTLSAATARKILAETNSGTHFQKQQPQQLDNYNLKINNKNNMEIDTNGTDHGDHDDRGAPGAAVLTPRSLSSSSSNGSAMAASAAAARNSLRNSAATPSSSQQQQQQHATTRSSASSSVGSSASTFQRFLTRGIGSGGGGGADQSTRINPDSVVQLTLSDDRDHTANIMRISTKNPFEDDDDDDNDDNASNDNDNNDNLLVGENGVAAATAADDDDDDDDDDDHTETMNNSAARPSLPSTTASARAAATSGRSIGTNSTLGFAHSVSSSTGNGNGNGGVNGSHHHHQGDAFYGTRQDDYANGWTLSGKMDMLGGRVDLRDDRGNLLAVVTKVATGGYTILEPTPSYEGQPPYRRKISRRFLYPVMTVHRNYFFSGGGFRRGRYRLAMADPSAKSYIAEDCGRGMLFGNSSRVLRIVPAGAKSSSLSGQQPPCALIRHSFYKGKVDKPQWDVVLMGLDNPRTMCPPRAILCFVAIINRSMGRS